MPSPEVTFDKCDGIMIKIWHKDGQSTRAAWIDDDLDGGQLAAELEKAASLIRYNLRANDCAEITVEC